MDKPYNIYHSYLIRMWRDNEAGGRGEPPAWQGELLHIQSGQKWPLNDLRDVPEMLQAVMGDE